MNWTRPATLAAIALFALVLIYVGYSVVVTERIDDRARTTTGESTRPIEPGSIQDLPATKKSNPPMVDSNVPPATPQGR